MLCFLPPLQNLERSEAQHKAEVECIKEQLKELRQKADRDKEALKKALRAQKERAERSEECAGQLAVQLAEKVPVIPKGRPHFRLYLYTFGSGSSPGESLCFQLMRIIFVSVPWPICAKLRTNPVFSCHKNIRSDFFSPCSSALSED